MTPTQISHYRIASQLGAGGMGEVYRARDTRLDREVAIKVLPAAFAKAPDRLRRFEQEVRATDSWYSHRERCLRQVQVLSRGYPNENGCEVLGDHRCGRRLHSYQHPSIAGPGAV